MPSRSATKRSADSTRSRSPIKSGTRWCRAAGRCRESAGAVGGQPPACCAKGERRRLVEQAQLSPLRVLRVGRDRERCRPSPGCGGSRRPASRCSARSSPSPVSCPPCRRVTVCTPDRPAVPVALVHAVVLADLRHPDVRVRQQEFADRGLEGEAVNALARWCRPASCSSRRSRSRRRSDCARAAGSPAACRASLRVTRR